MDLVAYLKECLDKGHSLQQVIDFFESRELEFEEGEVKGAEVWSYNESEPWVNLQARIDTLREEQRRIQDIARNLKPGERITKHGGFIYPPKVKRLKKYQIKLS